MVSDRNMEPIDDFWSSEGGICYTTQCLIAAIILQMAKANFILRIVRVFIRIDPPAVLFSTRSTWITSGRGRTCFKEGTSASRRQHPLLTALSTSLNTESRRNDGFQHRSKYIFWPDGAICPVLHFFFFFRGQCFCLAIHRCQINRGALLKLTVKVCRSMRPRAVTYDWVE